MNLEEFYNVFTKEHPVNIIYKGKSSIKAKYRQLFIFTACNYLYIEESDLAKFLGITNSTVRHNHKRAELLYNFDKSFCQRAENLKKLIHG